MRIAVCDDDALMLEQLQKYIKLYFEKACLNCPEIACFSDGEFLLSDKGERISCSWISKCRVSTASMLEMN